MKTLLLILPLLFFSCGKENETKIEGVKMGMAYKVLIREHIPLNELPKIEKLINDAFSEINTKLNGWNKDSEISKWNNSKSTQKIPASPLLLEIVNLADQVHSLSNGSYDPSLGKITYQWKQCLKLGKTLSSEEINRLAPASGWDKIIIHQDGLQKTHPEITLDLDGISKGFLCDLIKRELQAYGLKNFLVEWAGEIQTCGGPFKVLSGNKVILLTDRAIATSGSTFHLYPIFKDGKTIFYSHFINPQTLEPVVVNQKPSSKSICCESCAIADGLATASYISAKPCL